MQIKPIVRNFVQSNLIINSWSDIEPYFTKLLELPLNTEEQLNYWLYSKSEVETIVYQELAWRYIRTNCNTESEESTQAYITFIQDIEPQISVQLNALSKKLLESKMFPVYERNHNLQTMILKNEVDLFREENVSLFAEIHQEEQEFGVIASKMTINHDGKELPLPQTAIYLQDNDRAVREEVYKKLVQRRVVDIDSLNNLLSSLIRKRYHVAYNAGFINFRDYQHRNLNRFDYSPQDLIELHRVIEQEVCPLVDEILEHRRTVLGVDKLKPWDLEVDIYGREPLVPFKSIQELINAAEKCLFEIDPEIGELFNILTQEGYLDLESRKGKAPGGFNYPLYETNRSFIFMNASGRMKDFEVLVHEMGHAYHAYLCGSLPLFEYKWTPMEVAELSSMAIELFSVDHWHSILPSEDMVNRARLNLIEDAIVSLPWIAAIDAFQHWLYTNPEHSLNERSSAWTAIYKRFSSKVIDWEGVEEAFVYAWQRQLHLFEAPFYYIEYAIAHLGALSLWKKYRENPKETFQNYRNALSLGNTKGIPDIYTAAGIDFSFNRDYIREQANFIREQLKFST